MSKLEELRKTLNAAGNIVVNVKAIPRAAKSELLDCVDDGTLKVMLAAVAEKDKANDELCRLLADYFKVGKSHVQLLSGKTSRHKRLRITLP